MLTTLRLAARDTGVALMRRAIGVLVGSGVMRHLYPHYLVVGRKPC